MEKEKEYSIEDRKPQHCLCCGAVIEYGRIDKKFCNAHCKDEFHNRGRHRMMDMKRKIDRDLEVNYKILNYLLKLNVDQIPVQDLIAMGFKTAVATSYSRQRNAVCLGCYDISYCLSQARIFNIRRISLTLRQISNEK